MEAPIITTKKTPKRKQAARGAGRKRSAKKASPKKSLARKTAEKHAPENRTETGQFAKGISGNPGGRPKAEHRLKELAQEHTEAALSTLVRIMGDKEMPAAAQVSAACALLDRGYGKPTQAVSGPDGAPLDREINIIVISGKESASTKRVIDAKFKRLGKD